MSSTFEVEGLDSLLKKLENMGKEGTKIEDKAYIDAAKPILQDARSTNAFEDRTGKLRKSLKISKVKNGKDGKFVWIGDVDKEANYSWYIEFGDSKRRPRPFLKPAFDKNKDSIIENMKKTIQENLKSI